MKNVINNKRKAAVLSGLLVLLMLTAGATIAYLIDKTSALDNTFVPVEVTPSVSEVFQDNVKSDVKILNEGENPTNVYIRVKLAHTWYQETTDGSDVKQANKSDWTITKGNSPSFNIGVDKDWFYCEEDNTYYYRYIVPANASTTNLIDSITLLKDEDDGFYQGLEIYAEAIQAEGVLEGKTPVELAWGVTVNADGTISKN